MSTVTTEPMQRSPLLDIEGQRLSRASPGYAEALSLAHGRRRRPLCLCRPDGVQMYIARVADGFIAKRMPGTGERHAPHCTSFEPPPGLSGVGPLLGGAIKEDPSTGLTTLKLDFSLSNRARQCKATAAPSSPGKSPARTGRLSLHALLHYLWDQAELTRWHPAFEGRRSWGAVRHQLLLAAMQMVVVGDVLTNRLDVPEPFTVESRDAILARRRAKWATASITAGGTQRMLLLVAEVKALATARHGYKVVIKHVPDVAFAIEETLYRWLERRFARELDLWSASNDVHMVIIATVSIGPSGLPRLAEANLLTVSEHWLPIETLPEMQTLATAVRQRRSFVKILRYDLDPGTELPSLVLTDRGETVLPVHIGDLASLDR